MRTVASVEQLRRRDGVTSLLLDEMLTGVIAEQLCAREIDAVAVVEDVSLVGAPDEQLLEHATAQPRILVTANVSDFAAIATAWRATSREHAGLIYVTNRAFPQSRSFIGAIVSALGHLHDINTFPSPGTEVFLRPT